MSLSTWVQAVANEYGDVDPHVELARAMAAGGDSWRGLPNAKLLVIDLVKLQLLETSFAVDNEAGPVSSLAKQPEVWTLQVAIPERFIP